jgi:hypothetical protein
VIIHRFIVVMGLITAGQFAAGLLAGCASALPVYPAMSDTESLTTIADRQARVTSISSECRVDLTDTQGQVVRLEAALVAELPGKVRMRAWKFGHAIFDLTLTDGKMWVLVPEEGPGAGRINVDALPARSISEALNLLGPDYFRSARPAGSDGPVLLARGPAFGQDDVLCEISRSTLTARRFSLGNGSGSETSTLTLDNYALIGDLVWPMRWRLQSPSGEVVIRLHEVELNGEVPPGAFSPPARAKALP